MKHTPKSTLIFYPDGIDSKSETIKFSMWHKTTWLYRMRCRLLTLLIGDLAVIANVKIEPADGSLSTYHGDGYLIVNSHFERRWPYTYTVKHPEYSGWNLIRSSWTSDKGERK